jgi:hypothetical protein
MTGGDVKGCRGLMHAVAGKSEKRAQVTGTECLERFVVSRRGMRMGWIRT